MSFHDVFGGIIVAYALTVVPLLGRMRYRKLLRDIDAGVERVRERFYVSSMVSKWVLTALVGVWLATAPYPLPFVLPWASLYSTGASLLAMVVAIGISVLIYRRRGDWQLKLVLKTAGGLVPRTPRERRFFYAVCLTAGVSEEVIYRWFMVSYLMDSFRLELWQSTAVSSALFGVAHFYQGLWGVLLTGVLGAGFVGLWQSSGTLLTSIVVHFLVDLRITLVLGPERIRRLECEMATKPTDVPIQDHRSAAAPPMESASSQVIRPKHPL